VEHNKKEILERVLLLMKYDNKQTLSENLEKVQILEQPSPGTNSYKRAVQNLQGVKIPKMEDSIYEFVKFLDRNQDSPDFNNVFDVYLMKLSNTDLTTLISEQKKLAKENFGSITRGFDGYKQALNAGPAIAMLENQIYALRYKDYIKEENEFDKKYKELFFSPAMNFKGIPKTEDGYKKYKLMNLPAPERPTYTLMNSMSQFKVSQLQISQNTAQSLYNIRRKGEQDSKEKKRGCIFTNKEEGDDFRGWVNTYFPEIAKKIDLDKQGDFCNQYIKNAANTKISQPGDENGNGQGIFHGQTLYKVYKLNRQFDFEPNFEYPPMFDFSSEGNIKNPDFENYVSRKVIDKGLGPKFEGEFTYDDGFITTYLNNLQKLSVAKTSENPKAKEETVKDYSSDETLLKIFGGFPSPNWVTTGEDKIKKAFEECDYKLASFFDGILSGNIKDSNGNEYGIYLSDKKEGGKFNSWPLNKKIYCESKFWEDWGDTIQWGGMILSIVLMIPSLGTSLTFGAALGTRIFISVAIDVGVNLTAAKFNKDAGRDEEAAADVYMALLSAFVEVKGVSKLLTGGLDEFAEEAVMKKYLNANIKSYKEALTFVDGLNKTEKKLFYQVIDNKQVKNQIKTFGRQKSDEIAKRIEGRNLKNLGKTGGSVTAENLTKNIIPKMSVTLLPQLDLIGSKLYAAMNTLSQRIYQREFTEQEWKNFESNIDEYFPEKSYDEIADEILNKPVMYQKAINDPEVQEVAQEQLMGEGYIIVDGKKQKVDVNQIMSEYREEQKKLKELYEIRKRYREDSEFRDTIDFMMWAAKRV
jgi:hypothetical protein